MKGLLMRSRSFPSRSKRSTSSGSLAAQALRELHRDVARRSPRSVADQTSPIAPLPMRLWSS